MTEVEVSKESKRISDLEGKEVCVRATIKDSFEDFEGKVHAILLLNTDTHLTTKDPSKSGIYVSQAGQVCVSSSDVWELGDLV